MRQNIKDHSFQKRSTARCQASTVRPTAQGSQDHRGSRAGAAIGPLSATAGRSGKFPQRYPLPMQKRAQRCSPFSSWARWDITNPKNMSGRKEEPDNYQGSRERRYGIRAIQFAAFSCSLPENAPLKGRIPRAAPRGFSTCISWDLGRGLGTCSRLHQLHTHHLAMLPGREEDGNRAARFHLAETNSEPRSRRRHGA